MRENDICSDTVATSWNSWSGSGCDVMSLTEGFGVEPQENLRNYTFNPTSIPLPNFFEYILNYIFRQVDAPRECLTFIWGNFEGKKFVVTVGVT